MKQIKYFCVNSDELYRINDGLEARNVPVDDVISITKDSNESWYTVWYIERT